MDQVPRQWLHPWAVHEHSSQSAVTKARLLTKEDERRQNAKKTCKIKTYRYITNINKDCGLLQDRPVLPSGKTPHDNTALL
jgi:hypothetical protein